MRMYDHMTLYVVGNASALGNIAAQVLVLELMLVVPLIVLLEESPLGPSGNLPRLPRNGPIGKYFA